MSTHYHVGRNMPGYLPESDVYTTTSKCDAARMVAADARETWEQIASSSDRPYRQGRASEGYVIVGNRDSISGREIAHWYESCRELDCEDGTDD